MIVYDKEQKQIVIPNGLGNVNIIINQGCDNDKPTPPQDGWGITGYFNNWGGTPDIPFEENGEWEGRPYKVIRGFEATRGEFKIRRNNAWTDSYTASFSNIPQFAKLIKGDINMSINDGVWDIYLFFRNDGEPNEMLILHSGTDLSTIQYEYTLTISTDKENAIIEIADSYRGMTDRYYGSVTVPMKYGCVYSINVFMEGYEDIYDEITCYNDEERSYTLTKIEGCGCNLINPIVFSEDAGNTINAESVEIPTFVYEGNQYYNVWAIRLDSDKAFKIQILFKPNNSGDAEPINIFGCEDTDWDNTTFGARIYQGQIYFRMSGEDAAIPYTENTWYNVEMGYNTTKRWIIVNGETLLEKEHTEFNRPNQDFMVGAIKSGGNAFRPFYGKIAAIYAEEGDSSRMWILPKEDGTMAVYVNNRENPYATLSGENNARFKNDYISGDGMKSLTWFNKGTEGGGCNLGVLDWTLTSPSTEVKNASDDGYDGYSQVTIRPENVIAQEKERAINDFKNKMDEITITENGTYSIDDQETIRSIAFDGYSYFNTGIFPTENIKIEACIKITNGNDSSFGGIIIGGGIGRLGESTENRGIAIGMNGGGIYGVWGAIKSRNKPYKIEGEGTTTVVLQKTDDSWVWDGEKGSFGASGLYIGGYNSNDIAVEKIFLQSIVYIKIWTDRNDDSTLITYTPKTNGNFDANGVELKRLGDGTTTYVEENVKKYPYGFKSVEVNVPDLNGSYDEGYTQGKIDGVNEQKSKLESISITENGVYSKEDGYNHIEVNVAEQMDIEEFGLNVWYYDLKRIVTENENINSDWEQAFWSETIQNVFPGIAMTISGQAVAKPFLIRAVDRGRNAIRIGKLVSNAYGTPISCSVVIIGAFDCKNIQTVDLEAFKYMTDLCYIDGMNGLGESFISPQTIDFTYCTNLFIKTNSRQYISNFAESLFNLSAGNKNSINTSTLKFKSAVQKKGENDDAIALMQSKGWTVEFV